MTPWEHITPPDEETLSRWLNKTKGKLFLFGKASGFLGSLLCNHDFVWDEGCGTAWCNGSTIGFDSKFFTWLTPESRLTVLVHELWHTGYDHMSRIGTKRCPDLWNQAADFVINNQMDHWGFDFSQLMQINPCLDHQYDNMTTEEVYALLEQNSISIPMPQPNPGNGQGQQGQGSGSNPGGPTGAPGKPGMSGDVRAPANKDDASAIKGKIVQAAQASKMSKEAGVIPGEVELFMDEFLNPILPWEVLLARFYTEISSDDYSWKRPSRRYEDEYLPSPDGDNRLEHLIYYMDVSGSVTNDQVLRFFSEVKFIHETYQPKRVTMVTFDTEIHDVFELEEGDPFSKFTIHGRGGTDLSDVQRHIKKHQPTAAVVFSDLYCYPMGANPGPPILWVVIDNKKAKVNFGKMIHIKA